MTYSTGDACPPSAAIARMPHSRPLPGEISPHVSTRFVVLRLGVDAACCTGTPWGMTRTFVGVTRYVRIRMSCAFCVITTTAAADSQTDSRTSRWCRVGAASTVCRTTMVGVPSIRSSGTTSSPSRPPKMPYSCCTIATSHASSARTDAPRLTGSPAMSSRVVGWRPTTDGSGRTSGESSTRTIVASRVPLPVRAPARASVNVASPQRVGGYVDRNP